MLVTWELTAAMVHINSHLWAPGTRKNGLASPFPYPRSLLMRNCKKNVKTTRRWEELRVKRCKLGQSQATSG